MELSGCLYYVATDVVAMREDVDSTSLPSYRVGQFAYKQSVINRVLFG